MEGCNRYSPHMFSSVDEYHIHVNVQSMVRFPIVWSQAEGNTKDISRSQTKGELCAFLERQPERRLTCSIAVKRQKENACGNENTK